MKKIFNILILMICISFSSCASGQIVYDEGVTYDGITYYDYYSDDYYIGNTPVICIGNLWYYQYWDTVRMMWYRSPVPRDLWWTWRAPYYHNRFLGGRWIGPGASGYRPYNGRGMRPGFNTRGGQPNRGIGYQPNMNRGGNQRGSQPNTQPRTQQGNQTPRGNVSQPTQSRSGFGGQSRSNVGTPSRSIGGGTTRGGFSGGASRGGMSSGGARGGRR